MRGFIPYSNCAFWSAAVLRRFSFADEAVIRNEQPLLRYSQSGRTLPHSKTQARKLRRGKIFARELESPRHPEEPRTALNPHPTLSLAKGEVKPITDHQPSLGYPPSPRLRRGRRLGRLFTKDRRPACHRTSAFARWLLGVNGTNANMFL